MIFCSLDRLENRELSHQLESSRLDMKNLEEHLFFLEERRAKEVNEFEENKVSLIMRGKGASVLP